MKIALDVDGVLADIIFVWLDDYNKTHNEPITKEDTDRWDFWKNFGYDKYRFYDDLSRCWSRWMKVPPMEQNLADASEKLNSVGTVDIVTARDAASTKYVKRWLEFYGIKYNDYVAVLRGRDKADLDYDVFIDDSPLYVVDMASRGRNVLLYDQPWNKSVITDSKIVRIKKLEEAVGIISDMSQKFGNQYKIQSFLDGNQEDD
ncbi:MAG TPA: hypothetical protein VI698_00685 [Nitrososphaerales archaeon]|nr:hypothetical protein [Nitrososphaerales archaeon]